MEPRLEAIAGPLKGATFCLTDELSFGRNAGNVVSIPHSSVADQHCLIKKEEGQFTLYSLETYGSVRVNEQAIKKRTLQNGDKIEIGESVFLVALSKASAADSPLLAQPELPPASTLILSLEEVLSFNGQPSPHAPAWLAPIAYEGNNLLVRACRTISSIHNLEDLEQRLVELISDIVPAERGLILLKGENPGDFAAVTGWDKQTGAELPVEESRQIILIAAGRDAESILPRPNAAVYPHGAAPLQMVNNAFGEFRFSFETWTSAAARAVP